MRQETLAVHAGRVVDPATGAVVMPIHLSTTFERDPDGGFPLGYVYSRTANPNRSALEAALSALEGGAAAAAFSSGMAAVMAVMQSLAPGDHILVAGDAYHGTGRLVRETFIPWGLAVTFVDMTQIAAVRAALSPNTRLLWVETPSNPLLKITDLSAIAELAHEAGACSVCDNTWATPVLQQPLKLGIDLVMHSTTKYLGGHSDLLGGAIVAREEGGVFAEVRRLQTSGGAVPSPFDCWLALRGIRTLPYRLRAQSENAEKVATYLSQHPAVEAVHYPGLPSHPGFAIASRQMALPGGMLSAQIYGGEQAANRVAARVRVFTRATSLGGTESLIEHRASIEGPESTTAPNLLRLSIGLEHPDDLIEDLEQALGR
ncbi:MAG: trans-sulfuration enzyme family protein [Ktedonobacterales bacterium]